MAPVVRPAVNRIERPETSLAAGFAVRGGVGKTAAGFVHVPRVQGQIADRRVLASGCSCAEENDGKEETWFHHGKGLSLMSARRRRWPSGNTRIFRRRDERPSRKTHRAQ